MPYLISCSGSKTIAAYDPYSNVILQTYSAGVTPEKCLVANESGIYSAQANSSLIMIHKYSHTNPDYRSAVAAEVSCLFSHKNLIFAGHVDGSLSIWDSVSGTLLARREALLHSAILSIDFNGKIVVLGSKSGSISAFSLIDLFNSKINSVSALSIFSGNNQSIVSVKIVAENRIVAASIDGFVQILNLPNFTNILKKAKISSMISLKSLNLGAKISSFAVSPNQTFCVAGLINGRILPVKILGPENSEEISVKNHHNSAVKSICFSEDGARFLTGDENGEVYFWNVNSCQIAQKTQFSGPVTNIIASFPAKIFAGQKIDSASILSNARHQKLIFPLSNEAKSLQKYQKAHDFSEIIDDSMRMNVPKNLAKKLGLFDDLFAEEDLVLNFEKIENIDDDEKVVISKKQLTHLERTATLAASFIDNMEDYL